MTDLITTPTATDMVDSLLSGGWDPLDNIKDGKPFVIPGKQSITDETYRMAVSYLSLFQTENGQEVLNNLVQLTLHQPYLPNMSVLTFEQIAMLSAKRDGQNEIVRGILQMMAIAKAGPPKTAKNSK